MKKTLSFALNVFNIISMPKRTINGILGITLICLIIGLMFDQLMGVADAEDSPIAKMDGKLLNVIDQYADEYYDNGTWNLTLHQYKAWIVTIAWVKVNGEGTQHTVSQGNGLKLNWMEIDSII